jgi:hypothetical protein
MMHFLLLSSRSVRTLPLPGRLKLSLRTLAHSANGALRRASHNAICVPNSDKIARRGATTGGGKTCSDVDRDELKVALERASPGW